MWDAGTLDASTQAVQDAGHSADAQASGHLNTAEPTGCACNAGEGSQGHEPFGFMLLLGFVSWASAGLGVGRSNGGRAGDQRKMRTNHSS